MIPAHVVRQTDFTGGQISDTAVRSNDKLTQASLKTAINTRLRSTGPVEARPGRTALFLQSGRTDHLRMGPASTFLMCFGNGDITIRDEDGATLATDTGYPWNINTAKNIVWARVEEEVILWYPGMKPVVLTWDGDAGWTFGEFEFYEDGQGKRYEPFWRYSVAGITMTPSDVTGTIDIDFSGNVLRSDHVGTRFRYSGRQIEIATVVDAQNGTATVIEQLFPSQRLRLAVSPGEQFSVGEVVEGETSGARGVIVAMNVQDSVAASAVVSAGGTGFAIGDLVEVNGGSSSQKARFEVSAEAGGIATGAMVETAGHYSTRPVDPVTTTTLSGAGSGLTLNVTWTTTTTTLDVVLQSAIKFENSETVVGPFGQADIDGSGAIDIVPRASPVWDEAACSDRRGWPQSGFSDQDRLGMCDIPGIQNGIMWSAIGGYTDFLPGDDPDDAMFERLNSQDRVYHVAPGSDEFVFTDRGVRYIPISESNPLRPGSVAFRPINAPASSSVKPLLTEDGVVYVDAGLGRILGIAPTGQTAAPYVARDLSEYHAALFNDPVCLASTTGDSEIPEKYIYVINGNRTVAVGRVENGKEWIGWVPWNSDGGVRWASGLDNDLLLTSKYDQNETAMVERLSLGAYLDAQITYNDVPAELAPGVGQGPLWWCAGFTVHVMDGLRYRGTRPVDADGFLTPEEGEVFTGEDIVAGLNWTTTIMPFIRHAPEGQSTKQTLRRRKIKKFGVYVQDSLGFVCANRRIPPWLQGEDQEGQPPLREGAYFFRVAGRSVDPEVEIVRDTPGSLRINEISYEVTV